MDFERERIYYIGIQINNSHKQIFNWSSHGNLAFGVAVAKEEMARRLKQQKQNVGVQLSQKVETEEEKKKREEKQKREDENKESRYSITIKIRNDKTNKTEFLVENRQGQIITTLNTVDDFVRQKLGFDLISGIKESMNEVKGVKS